MARFEQPTEGGIMVFYPTMEQMADFPAFIDYMESKGAHEMGVAKVRFGQ